MLKLCPLFLEGANLYIQIIALLCCVQHHNLITNLKPGLGTYWEIYTSRLHGLYLSHHVRTLSSGLALSMHGTRYFTVRDWDTRTRHSRRIRLSLQKGICYFDNYILSAELQLTWFYGKILNSPS